MSYVALQGGHSANGGSRMGYETVDFARLQTPGNVLTFGRFETPGLSLSGVNLIVVPSAEHAAHLAADRVWEVLAAEGQRVIGTATGGTMEPIWGEIHRRLVPVSLDCRQLVAVGLDEYVGLPPDCPQSYRAENLRNLGPLARFGFNPAENLHLPTTWNAGEGRPLTNEELLIECGRYERTVGENRPAVQLLGIGSDGHIGFSMPWSAKSSPASGTHLVTLSTETREANARFFGGDINAVPKHALTMGLGTLHHMAEAGAQLLLVATGQAKQDALFAALCGPVWSGCPASFLRLFPNVTVIADEAAAARLIR